MFQERVAPIPNYIVTELEKIDKSFLWANSIEDEACTFCNDYKDGGLKNVDILKKNMSLY